MKQSIFYLEDLEQLKSLSDPIRVKVLHLLIEHPYSGQQLSQKLNIPRSKVHYHLKNLEKNKLIYLVDEKQKGNMNEKIYQAVARSFIPSNNLLPIEEYSGESGRQMTLTAIDRTRERAIEAPRDSFSVKGEDPKDWLNINSQLEVRTSQEKFKAWVKKYQELLYELNEINDEEENSNWYYVATVGFKINEPLFKNIPQEPESKND